MRSRPLFSIFTELLRQGRSCTHTYKRFYADVVSAPVGYGLERRLKDTPSEELKTLISRTKAANRQSIVGKTTKLEDSDGLPQWERLDCRVIRPFQSREITQQDIFAVVEAGPTQYKGAP